MRVDHPQQTNEAAAPTPHFGPTNLLTTLFHCSKMPLAATSRPYVAAQPDDEARSLQEENARLRQLVAQLSEMIRKNTVHPR